jgi:MoxR-like ATPase
MARVRDVVHAQWLANVPSMVDARVAQLMPTDVRVTIADKPPVVLGRAHKALPLVLNMVASGASLFLVGPAGSGKTTLAENVATALGRKFYMAARVTSEFKLVGFVDANGRTVRTQFRDAYEHGGVFLFDEIDASDPDALTAFNAALANGYGDFPDGMVKRHADFIAIAAGNTFGRGADRQYVGRNQLDAATLDRFQVVEIDYDEALEHDLAGNREWSSYVQKVRAAIEREKVRHIVSPRASIRGAAMLAQGIERKQVEEACIWKGLPTDARSRVEHAMRVGG